MYLPIPYSKHLKITYETKGINEAREGTAEGPNRTEEMFYYQINYRSYEKSTKVETFTMKQLEKNSAILRETLLKLENNSRNMEGIKLKTDNFSGTISPGKDLVVSATGTNAIRKLQLKLNAKDLPQALRSTVISLSFDGNQTVWAPVGDFFGTGYQINASSTWYHEVLGDGTLQVYWIMPFQKEFEMKLTNLGEQEVKVTDRKSVV